MRRTRPRRGLILGLWLSVVVLSSPAEAAAKSPYVRNLPGGLVLLIPLAIGIAIYISRKLGPQKEDDDSRPKREGAVSRALNTRKSP